MTTWGSEQAVWILMGFGAGLMEVCGKNILWWQKTIVRGPHLMVMGALAIDPRWEWTRHSTWEDRHPFVCKRSRDGGQGGGGQYMVIRISFGSASLLQRLCFSSLLVSFFYLPSSFSQTGSRIFQETQSEIYWWTLSQWKACASYSSEWFNAFDIRVNTLALWRHLLQLAYKNIIE